MDEAFQTEIANIRMNKKKTKIRSFSDSDFEDSGGKIEIKIQLKMFLIEQYVSYLIFENFRKYFCSILQDLLRSVYIHTYTDGYFDINTGIDRQIDK